MKPLVLMMWLLAAVLLGPGCGKKHSSEPPSDARAADLPPGAECESDDQCPRGETCFMEKCVDEKSRVDMLRQRGNMTPDKVRREVEKQTEQYQKQLDRGLDMDE